MHATTMTLPTAQLADLYAPVQADLAAVERVFDAEVRSDVAFINELSDTVRSYRGKMLRPALLLLTAQASGEVTPAHHTLGAVVEMVHMATLVHDDVLDEADERRRRPTVRAVAGNVAAVLLGDYLISHAFHLCSSLNDQDASRRIGATTNIVCEGELLQNLHRHNWKLTEAEYYDIIGRKTATLTAVACELGARFAGAERTVVDAMASFGHSVGLAFQIVDDTLDIVGDPREVGKTLGLDASLGKLTLPVLAALAEADATTAAEIRGALGERRSASPIRLRELIETSRGIEYANNVAREHVVRAVASLAAVPPSDARSSLSHLAEFVVMRKL